MGLVRCLRGIGSGVEYPPDSIMNLCPVDNRPVEIVLDIPGILAHFPDKSWYHPERPDMWRFGAMLPLDINDEIDKKHIIALGEGNTPFLDYSDHPLAKQFELNLEIKEEGLSRQGYGQNPTHSFKDRGMAMAVSMAGKLGLRKLAVPTQGNAGDALTEYGHAAGMEVAIVMPRSTPMPILGKVAAFASFYDHISLDVVEGTIREAGQLIKEKYLPRGYFSVATFQEPGWRIEGKKTMGYEIAEPRKDAVQQAPSKQKDQAWRLPDVIIYPTGGGTGILGLWKAFDEMEAIGLIDHKRPRIISIQSDRTAPIVEAFLRGDRDTRPVSPGETLAFGLNVPGGVGHFKVLEIIYESKGCALAISEAEIATTLRHVFKTKSWLISPEGAACIASLPHLIKSKHINPGDHVIAFNTGSLEKYLPALRDVLRD